MVTKKIDGVLHIQQALWWLVIFCIPSNLFFNLLPNTGYVGGLQIDYLLPKIYLVDLLIGMILGLQIVRTGISKTGQLIYVHLTNNLRKPVFMILAILCLTLLVRQLFTPFAVSAIWFLGSSALRATFAIWLIKKRNQFQIPVLMLMTTLLFQASLGLFQFLNQSSLLGFWFLGEPTLNSQPGLSTVNFAYLDQIIGTKLGLRILPYGSTPHPNVLAGFLVIGLLILSRLHIRYVKTHIIHSVLAFFLTAIVLIVVFLTQSLTAWTTLILGMVALYFNTAHLKKKRLCITICLTSFILVPTLLHLSNSFLDSTVTSISRRTELNFAAIQMIQQWPLLGVGANQFTQKLEEVFIGQELVRFVQPAHNTGLLFLAENGLLGVLGLLLFLSTRAHFYQASLLTAVIILLPILTLDHYLYTLPQGQLSFYLLIVILTASQTKREIRIN